MTDKFARLANEIFQFAQKRATSHIDAGIALMLATIYLIDSCANEESEHLPLVDRVRDLAVATTEKYARAKQKVLDTKRN